MDGKEHFGQFLDERRLLLRRQHQIPVALLYRSQRRKNPPVHAEVHRPHMRALFRALQTQRNPPKVLCIHHVLISPRRGALWD